MSNVFKRFHTPTGQEYKDNLAYLNTDLTKYMMNEKHVPKRYLYIYVVPILARMEKVHDQIKKAERIYPDSLELVGIKKDAWQDTIDALNDVVEAIQRMILVLNSDLNKLDQIGDRINYEFSLLTGMRDGVRLQAPR